MVLVLSKDVDIHNNIHTFFNTRAVIKFSFVLCCSCVHLQLKYFYLATPNKKEIVLCVNPLQSLK